MQLPIAHSGRFYCMKAPLRTPSGRTLSIAVRVPSPAKMLCLLVGFLYPFIIFVAIISTANHFILDAVVGAAICLTALHCNEFMLNFLPIEDCLLWCLRIHKPSQQPLGLLSDQLQRYERT
jgi:hypothetical protein